MISFFPLAILSVLAVVGGGSSSVLSRSLHKRYVDPSIFPTQCQSTCLPIVNALNTCAFPSCICTNANGKNTESCGDCVLQVDPLPSEVAQVQYVFNYFTDFCLGAGIPITPLSISLSGPSTTFAITASPSAGVVTGGPSTVTVNGNVSSAARSADIVTVAEGASSAAGNSATPTGNPLKGAGGRARTEMTWLPVAGWVVVVLLALS